MLLILFSVCEHIMDLYELHLFEFLCRQLCFCRFLFMHLFKETPVSLIYNYFRQKFFK
jgi:hypothetical protein